MRATRAGSAVLLALGLALGGCVLAPSTSTAPSPLPSPSGLPSALPSVAPSLTEAPSPTPAPFALAPPSTTDPRAVSVTIEPTVDGAAGELLVTVSNPTAERIDEVVLRWATDLDAVLFIAPFEPSEDRIRDGGPPLVQDWTKWVVGPGERGEPAGTTSVGYGPILPGTTLAIPLLVERRQVEPVSFDLQVLSGNDLLQLTGGGPAALRIEIP